MDFELGIGGLVGELGSLGNIVTGESPAAVKAREFLGALFGAINATPALKAQLIEALTALKNTDDEVWKDVKHAERFAIAGALKLALQVLDT